MTRRAFAPNTHVRSTRTTILASHSPCPDPHASELLEAALKEANVSGTFYTVKGGGHGGFNDPLIGQMITEFFAQR